MKYYAIVAEESWTLYEIFTVFTVFIHSATNVTLDITFTSYITFLTYKHY